MCVFLCKVIKVSYKEDAIQSVGKFTRARGFVSNLLDLLDLSFSTQIFSNFFIYFFFAVDSCCSST